MITGAIKNKVDKIWTDIWAGGITNPLTVIEQLTYLMFIRSLDEKELETEELENLMGEKMEHAFVCVLLFYFRVLYACFILYLYHSTRTVNVQH